MFVESVADFDQAARVILSLSRSFAIVANRAFTTTQQHWPVASSGFGFTLVIPSIRADNRSGFRNIVRHLLVKRNGRRSETRIGCNTRGMHSTFFRGKPRNISILANRMWRSIAIQSPGTLAAVAKLNETSRTYCRTT